MGIRKTRFRPLRWGKPSAKDEIVVPEESAPSIVSEPAARPAPPATAAPAPAAPIAPAAPVAAETPRAARTPEQVSASIEKCLRALKTELAVYKQLTGEHSPLLYSGDPAPVPNQALLGGCRVVTSREDILRALPKGGRFAEVGTLYGNFAVSIKNLAQPAELHIFDVNFERLSSQNREKLADAHFHQGTWWEQLAEMPPGYFDAVYLDADNSYDAVSRNLSAAFAVTKPGGYIICNDYTLWSLTQCAPYGVFRAVNRFAAEKQTPFAFLALQPNGYYDVALRKLDV